MQRWSSSLRIHLGTLALLQDWKKNNASDDNMVYILMKGRDSHQRELKKYN